MADGTLIFLHPADGTGRLVFGDTGDTPVVPDAHIELDAEFANDLPAEIGMRVGRRLAVDAEFVEDMPASIGLRWDANVWRDEMVQCREHWQDATHTSCLAGERWQEGERITALSAEHWQDAAATVASTAARWQEGQRLISSTSTRWQDATELRHLVAERWQEGQRLRHTTSARWQDAAGLRHLVAEHWQEQLRLRHLVRTHWQDASELRRILRQHSGPAIEVRIGLSTRWQDASRPPAGRSIVKPPDPPLPEPCYDPATLGTLIFDEPWVPGDGRLVFVCVRKGEPEPPGALIVVPLRSVYMTHNHITLQRIAGGITLPAVGVELSLDDTSFTWGWSASFAGTREVAAVLAALNPDSGEPVEVELTINGVPYRLLTDPVDRQRQFAKTTLRVPGRGLAAELDAPSARQMVFSQASARTAQQLAAEALEVNGVGIGWDIDWGLTDWLVPGGVWSHQGTHISAVSAIAAAAGGYLQPHRTARTLRILPRYPAPPWQWPDLTPDIELPVGPVVVEGIQWQRLPDYNRVYVRGEGVGVLGQITRAGTAGDVDAPMVVDPLITASEVARQAGIAVLGNTGRQAIVTLSLPVLDETGLILPGKLVRYVDGSTVRLGLVRSTALSWQRPKLRQSIKLETHILEGA